MRKPEFIFNDMLKHLTGLEALNKELEDNITSGPEYFAVEEIAQKIKDARTKFEQRMEK